VKPDAASPAPPPAPKRILVVDDDLSTCRLVQAYLTKRGYEVALAHDATTGLGLIQQQSFDLVVSDMIMPGLSGFDLLLEVKKLRPLMPVIIITGKPKVEAAVACMRTGAFDYLTKPLNLTRFLEHVQLGLEASDRVKRASRDERPERYLTRWHNIAGYDLVKVLGEGGLGVVFLAEKADAQGQLQRYALKVLKPDILAQEDGATSVERFLREARLASSTIHPNIIRIFDYGVTPEEQIPYIVMEYIQGEPLSYYIMNGDLLNYTQKAYVIRQAASALAAVHAAHLYHRDIKPDNILIGEDLRVILTDFGIATNPDAHRLTTTGFLIGSPAYMPPEAYQRKQVDARSDIFALGTVAYELFLGVAPFDGDSLAELADAIQHDEPLDPLRLDAHLPKPLAEIIAKMLAKRPDDRFQTARNVVTALDQYLKPESQVKHLSRKPRG
jgi:CheY-like chemotaxis protein